ncbi:nucleolar complex protein 3 homolog [Macrosteles quadrilineatus]|uniref:nucleolar complex protein 3 homolog n=1 Tax=Macrosteles quadrilineatus TaxID=74068 RepID=UPI0023E24A80|nr:nucleolar complex protein 3 homolog [Macrosteles quadrilineatus]
MTVKSKKTKTSKVKKKNITKTKLYKQGKIKTKKNKISSSSSHITQNVNHEDAEKTTLDRDNILQTIEVEDLEYLRKAVSSSSYSLYSKLSSKKDKNKKRKRTDDHLDKIEEEYEKDIEEENKILNKRTRHLLPVKTSEGLVRRTIEEEVPEEDETLETVTEDKQEEKEEGDDELAYLPEFGDEEEEDVSRPLSTAEILAKREQLLAQYKYRIGLLASGLLEDPQNRVKNISLLLDTMNESKPEVRLTVQKLVLLSLTEVFKDILPSYQISHHEDNTVKLKKDTKTLHDYEKSLLKGYRLFLMRLEKMAKILQKKKGDNRDRSEQIIKLGDLAINCISELLVSHPYFNYNKNIVQMLTPYLNHPREAVRQRVASCYTHVFKEDKRGEITLDIVRRINHLVKSRSHTVHKEVISVLLGLRIKDINLDQEKESEIKQKKFMTHKQKLLAMSKKERKRSKKLEQLEKELLETKAEENKQSKQKQLTEVMKVVFTIYFRILKKAPSSKVLSSALEGLAKFAHCINVEFFADLIGVLDSLMDGGTLRPREKLHCVETVFSILSGQGEVLNIDPSRFYTHLYNNLFYINAGKTHEDVKIVLRILEIVLIQRRKKITHQRLLAFTKRLSILGTQLLHNGCLGALAIVRRVMQLGMGVDVLLDVDPTLGQGVYNPELEEPEHCNPASTALWELSLLQRHYHPTVRNLAQHIVSSENSTSQMPMEISNLNCVQIFDNFDPSQVVFKPAIPPPAKNVTGVVKVNESSQFVQSLSKHLTLSKSRDGFSTLHTQVSNHFKKEKAAVKRK